MGKRKEKVEGELKVSCLNGWKNGTGLKKKKKKKRHVKLGRGMMGLGIEHFQFEMEP